MIKYKLIEEQLLNEIIDDFINNHLTISELQEKYKIARQKITYNLYQKNIDTNQNHFFGKNKNRIPRYPQEFITQVINDYVNNHVSIVYLSQKYNISMPTIVRWLKRNNINILSGGAMQATPNNILEQAMNYYINENLSIAKAAKKAGISKNTLKSYLKEKNLIRHKYNVNKAKFNTSIKPNTKIFNHNIFSELKAEEQYYWLGFIFADGIVKYDTESYNYILNIVLSIQDKEHLEKFLKFIDAQNINIKEYIHIKNDKQFKAVGITFFSKQLTSDLIKYGCIPNKSDNGYLKWQYFDNILDEYKIAFLRGYIDGNGTIYSNNLNIKISIHSTQLANDIHKLILSLNINAKLYCINRAGGYIYSIEITKKNDRLNFCKLLYNNTQIYLERKYDKYQEYLRNLAVQN